jgi:hypothetical protein
MARKLGDNCLGPQIGGAGFRFSSVEVFISKLKSGGLPPFSLYNVKSRIS